MALRDTAREPAQPIAIGWRCADLDTIATLIEQAVVQPPETSDPIQRAI